MGSNPILSAIARDARRKLLFGSNLRRAVFFVPVEWDKKWDKTRRRITFSPGCSPGRQHLLVKLLG